MIIFSLIVMMKRSPMEQSFNYYYIFYKTALSKNISKTAKELYLSQPAVSKTISRLEESLNCALFIRSSKGVELTPQGELLFQATQNAFETIADSEQKIKESLSHPNLHLTIGASSTLCKYVLVPYLKEFTKKYPEIRISILSHPTMECISLLENDLIDIGFVGTQIKQKHLDYHEISEIQDTFVVSHSYLNHYQKQYPSIYPDYREATFMMLDQENLTRKYVDDYLLQKRFPIQKIMEVTSMDLLIDFAKADLGIACLIKEFIQEELDSSSLVELPFDLKIPKRKIGFVTKEKNKTNEALDLFLNFYALSANKKS